MSRIFEALQQSSIGLQPSEVSSPGTSTKLPETIARMHEDSLSLRSGASFSITSSPEKRLVAISDRFGLGAEKLRMLSARLKYLQHRRSVKRLLITSTIRGEGKTTISANLGLVLAQQRQKVLLIDGDLHQPALSELFGISLRPGLSDWWRQQQEIGAFLCRAEGLPLWCLTGGTSLDQPLTMLQSPEIAQLINNISALFDWVIIDSPPLAPLADASAWSTIADSILLVCRQGMTPKKVLEQSIPSLEKAKILGAVLNDADSTEHRYYTDYYKQSANRGPARNPQPTTPAATPRQKT